MHEEVKIIINKRETMIFDDMNHANQFIDSFTRDFAENIMFSAPKDTHLNHVEATIVFYQPFTPKPEGQEAVLLDIQMPKEG